MTAEPIVDIEIQTEVGQRLIVRAFDTPNGKRRVAIIPEFLGRGPAWRLAHSAVTFDQRHALRLAKAITRIAVESTEGGAG